MRRALPIALLLAAALPGAASAYKVNRTDAGAEVHWGPWEIPVFYRLQAAGSADISDGSELTALQASFETWQSVSCASLRFERGPDYPDPPRISCNDGVNLLMWLEDDWPADVGPEAIGVTTACHDVGTGEIVDADIWFNGVHFTWATDGRGSAVDVSNIATHEMGHFFGLGHSEYADATMYYASAGDGETLRRSLSTDDEAAVCYLYPTDCAVDGDCTPPETCERGRCVPPPPPPAGVGEPCTEDQSCRTGTGTDNAVCLADAQGFPGGYCVSLDCSAQNPCPEGGVCEQLGTASDGSPINGCTDACRVSAPDCREAYVCYATGQDEGVCWPKCFSDADCDPYACDEWTGTCVSPGDDSAVIGDPCNGDAQCPTGAACASQARTGFPAGYCTRLCGAGRPCPDGSTCYTVDDDGTALCFADCALGGTGDCRADYACWPMGSGPGVGACMPACVSDRECGDGLVCDDVTGLCVEPPPPPPDGGTPDEDGGTPAPDAGVDPADGGSGPAAGGAASSLGCGCGVGPGGAGAGLPLWLLALGVVALSRRRR